MKIVAGLGSADAYDAYVDAGADEVFCGYVPESWSQKYGMALPLNRREVRYYDVQLGGRSELLYLAERIAARGVPATITLNALHYGPTQYPELAELVVRCIQDGFRSFIVADPALLVYLYGQGLHRQAKLHVSGEVGQINRGLVSLCQQLGASRMILHRKTTLMEMASLIRQAEPHMEFEAFVLNEMCHFHGGYCLSLHCDELTHLCRVPYQIGPVDSTHKNIQTSVCDRCVGHSDASDDLPRDIPGMTGCGLCALWAMQQAGVSHLKVVGRGNHVDAMIRDIRALRQALKLLENTADEASFQSAMKQQLFPQGCSQACYYR